MDAEGIVVEDDPVTIANPGEGYVLSNVYTKIDWIDRAEAERMLDVYLAKVGFTSVHYRWEKPEHLIIPVTVGTSEGDPNAPK